MALRKLSFRDKVADRMDRDMDWGTQQPSIEQHQKGLNKMKPSPSNTTPPPGVVVDQKKMNDGKIMKTLKDQAGKLFKQIFDGTRVIYDSRGGATARDNRRLRIAMIVSKASKEAWIAAEERVIERLMNENKWDWDTAYDHVSKNTDLVDMELSEMYPEDDPRIPR